MINYLDRIALSVSGKSIAHEFGLSSIQLGYLFSSFLWLYVVCLIPMGVLVDRLGTRTINAAGIALWSAATIVTGAATGFGALLASRLVMGIGESTTYPAAGRVLREWMPAHERGIAATVFNSGAYFGPAVGAIVLSALVAAAGWRMAFYLCGGLGFVWLVAWLFVYRLPERASWLARPERDMILRERNAVAGAPANAGKAAAAPDAPALGLAGLLAWPTLWALMLTQGCAVYTQYLFLTWLPSYLQAQKGMTMLKSGTLMALPFFGAVVLAVLLGLLSDRLLKGRTERRSRRRTMVAGTMLCSAVILAAPAISNVYVILVLIMIALTGVSTAVALNIALLSDLLDSAADIGRATAVLIFGGNVFGLLAPIVTGYVIAETHDYEMAFALAGALLVIGCASCLLFARNTTGYSAARAA
jgi:ACS family glucarate transporter-like MFS transporter